MHLPQSNHSTIISISFLILLAVIFILLMVFGRSVFIPVIIAIVIWFLIMDMTENIQRIKIAGRHIPRRLAMSLGIILIVFVSVRVARLFYATSLDLLTDIPSYQQNINTLLEAIPDYVWTMFPSSDEERFSSDIDRLLALATDYFSAYIASLAGNVVNIIIQSALTLIYVIFLLLEQNTFATKIDNMFPNPKRRAEMKTILDSIKLQVQRYVSIKTFVSVLTGIISYIVMWLFELEYALVWAIFIFLLNYIPYIGSIFAVAFPFLMALLQFGTWPPVIGLLLLLILVQFAVGYFIEPIMMGSSLDISPFVVLVSLAVFGTIWGITGMFLSIPLVIILIIVFSHFEATRPIAVMLSGDGDVYGVIAVEEPAPPVALEQRPADG